MKNQDISSYVDQSIRRETFDKRGSILGKLSNISEGKGDVTSTNGGVYRRIMLPHRVTLENDMWVNLERSGGGYYISGAAPHGAG